MEHHNPINYNTALTRADGYYGSFVAIVTPFDGDLNVNFEKLTELVEWQIAEGSSGIVACGTTGEASTLDDDERLAVVAHVVKVVNKRIPVVAGTGSNNSRHSLHLSLSAEKEGADGLLLITPYYNKSNDEGLYRHFKLVADAVHIPIIVYNIPGRTGLNIPVPTLKRLAQIENIVAIKEAGGNLDYVLKIAKEAPNLAILSGNDSQVIPIMSVGGRGVISTSANVFPNAMAAMCDAFAQGNTREAARLQVLYANVIESLFLEVNPIPVKAAMNLLGWNVGGYRLPLYPMSEKNRTVLEEELRKAGVCKMEKRNNLTGKRYENKNK
ncbi:MAG: 4-hydroxy-tetrahydrodipicolinate synthase [Prevotellaceae bacterium]|jgi:4-hydroxy-tetrahydrodipicolinate synthase|nr:4-hydroxy-tetrahydrodipicolinate synthase [Prevotellaceae bacterium]